MVRLKIVTVELSSRFWMRKSSTTISCTSSNGRDHVRYLNCILKMILISDRIRKHLGAGQLHPGPCQRESHVPAGFHPILGCKTRQTSLWTRRYLKEEADSISRQRAYHICALVFERGQSRDVPCSLNQYLTAKCGSHGVLL